MREKINLIGRNHAFSNAKDFETKLGKLLVRQNVAAIKNKSWLAAVLPHAVPINRIAL